MLQDLAPLSDLARIMAGLGVVTVLLAVLKRNAERRRWRRFKSHVRGWLTLLDSSGLHPKELTDDDWRVECERLLEDAGFTPSESDTLIGLAVSTSKGLAAERYFAG